MGVHLQATCEQLEGEKKGKTRKQSEIQRFQHAAA